MVEVGAFVEGEKIVVFLTAGAVAAAAASRRQHDVDRRLSFVRISSESFSSVIKSTTRKYHTLILAIGPGYTPEPVITIGFLADF
jgi:hypothetical protein